MTSTTKGSEAVAILESIYAACGQLVEDLPSNVAFTITPEGGNKLGHFAPSRLNDGETPVHEICVTGSSIRRGALSVVTTVIHEAVHALAKARGVQDTSRQGRWHNKRFVELAEELGLVYDHRYPDTDETPARRRGKMMPDDAIGFSAVSLDEEGQTVYYDMLTLCDDQFPFDLGAGEYRETRVRRRVHQYLAFRDDTAESSVPGWDIIQLSPQKYARLAPHLDPHVTCQSIERQDDVESYLSGESYETPCEALRAFETELAEW